MLYKSTFLKSLIYARLLAAHCENRSQDATRKGVMKFHLILNFVIFHHTLPCGIRRPVFGVTTAGRERQKCTPLGGDANRVIFRARNLTTICRDFRRSATFFAVAWSPPYRARAKMAPGRPCGNRHSAKSAGNGTWSGAAAAAVSCLEVLFDRKKKKK